MSKIEKLNPLQVEALRLRELAIKKITTPLGRSFLRLSNSPSFITRGIYLPAPALPRHLQINPDVDSSFSDVALSISRGYEVPVTGMTTIGFHEPYVTQPKGQIIYDFIGRNSVNVHFYESFYRHDPSSDYALEMILALRKALGN